MAVPPSLLPSHSEKTLGAMKAERTVKRITFTPSRAEPGETLYVNVPKLDEHEVLVPGSLALVFNINLTGGHANNYLEQNVSRALVSKLHVKFAATSVHEMAGYDIYKIFEDLFLLADERANMLSEGIQSVDLCRIRSGSGDKKTSGVDEENKLQSVYTNQYRINLDHPILTDHGVFYQQALYSYLIFELTLAPLPKWSEARMQASSCTSWKPSSWSTRRSGARVWPTRPPALTPTARSSPTTSSCANGCPPFQGVGTPC